jgi:hypothetical protein
MRFHFWIPKKIKRLRFTGYRWEPMSGPYIQAFSMQAGLICACIEWEKRKAAWNEEVTL